MADFTTIASPNQTIYALIFDASGNVFDNVGGSFVTYDPADQSNYAVPMTEQSAGSPYYNGSVPTGITAAGTYSVVVYQRMGAQPDQTDPTVAESSIDWDGAAIINPVVGDNIITLAYAKQFIGITGNGEDPLLTALVTAASAAIIDYCNRTFRAQAHAEYIDGNDDTILQLGNVPVITLTSVTLNPDDVNPEVIPGSDYRVNQKTGQVKLKPTSTHSGWFPQGWQNVLVNYVAGYTTYPADLQQACAFIVQRLYQQKGTQLLATMEKLGDYQATYTLAQTFCDDISVKTILDAYRNWVI